MTSGDPLSVASPPDPPDRQRPAAAAGPRPDRSPLDALVFDADWYLDTYPDVARRRVDPVQHYFAHGVAEGRNPNRHFDTRAYLAAHPDVERAGINPFYHFVFYGFREGRTATAPEPSPPPTTTTPPKR